ncbi:MAG: DMT family transporter [Lachnospiraceae bacterium]|nr:DMT family transporter [Lachnospiraceae bacterium]
MTGLGSGLGYALVTVFTRYALKRGYRSLTIVIYTLTFASLGTCFLIDIRPVFSYVFSDKEHFLFCMIFVLISTILPNLFYTYGLSGMENGRATIIVSVEPIAATVAGVAAFGEKLGADGFIGIVLMLISLIVINAQKGENCKE